MKELTEKQKNILEFIEDFQEAQGMAPTVYEISDRFGIKSSTVFAHIKALERKKELSRSSKARSISLLKSNMPVRLFAGALTIPLLGRVNAGLPAEGVEHKEGEILVDAATLGNVPSDRLFALKVQGESMRDLGMYENDVIIVERDSLIRPGDVVVAQVAGEVTVKSFYPKPGGNIELRPANTDFKPQVYPASAVEIQGKVLLLQRKF